MEELLAPHTYPSLISSNFFFLNQPNLLVPVWLATQMDVWSTRIVFDESKSILVQLNAFGYKNTLDKIGSGG